MMKQRSEPDARDEREERKRKQTLRRIASTNLSDSQQAAAHQSLRRQVKPRQQCLAKGRPEHAAVPPAAELVSDTELPMHPCSTMRSVTHSQITVIIVTHTPTIQRTHPDSMERSDRRGEERRAEQNRRQSSEQQSTVTSKQQPGSVRGFLDTWTEGVAR